MPEGFSVVIPAFNAARFIRRTIDSVLAQRYCDYEIIVVDDGSTDDSAEVVKSYGPKVRYIYQENAGGASAWNTAIAAAKSDWIAFLDHDDEWLPEKLELQMALLDRNPTLRWCGANYYKAYFDRQAIVGNVEALREELGSRGYFTNFITTVREKGYCFSPSTMVVHREIFEKIGRFSALYCADIDMWLRIAYRFPQIGYVLQPLAIMHLDVQNVRAANLRLASKRGVEVRELVARHLKLSQGEGCLDEFKSYAKTVLRNSLRTTLFHGLKDDARDCVAKFPDMFSWYIRYAVVLLTVFPRLTSGLMRTISYLRRALGLKREVTRRYSQAELTSAAKEDGA